MSHRQKRIRPHPLRTCDDVAPLCDDVAGVCDLLVRLGMAHPQGLCFPLTVASHSPAGSLQHVGASKVRTSRILSPLPSHVTPAPLLPSSSPLLLFPPPQVLDAIRRQFDILVQQAHLVASELIRSSALWSEQWQIALEQVREGERGAVDFHDNNGRALGPASLPSI